MMSVASSACIPALPIVESWQLLSVLALAASPNKLLFFVGAATPMGMFGFHNALPSIS
jgi:hypothetical protein